MFQRSTKFPLARFYCRLCDYHCDTVIICRRHVQDTRHLRLKTVFPLCCGQTCILISMVLSNLTYMVLCNLACMVLCSPICMVLCDLTLQSQGCFLITSFFYAHTCVLTFSQIKTTDIFLRNLPPPTAPHCESLTEVLEQIVEDQGLSKQQLADRLQAFDTITAKIKTRLPGESLSAAVAV